MKTHDLLPLTFLLAILATGCSCRSTSPDSLKSATLADTATHYYRDIKWRLPEGDFKYANEADRYSFLREHRDEMLKTLEVVETAQTENIAVAFVRYSLGARIYHDAAWMRKVDGSWRPCWVQYFSKYDDDPFGDGKPDAAKALIQRVDEWSKESPKAWW